MNDYNLNGYHLEESAFNSDWILRAQKTLDNLESKVNLPFSDIPWGYGQLFDVSPFDEILKNKVFKDFCSGLFNTDDYKINHLLVSNKSSFIGPEEMWHQEWPNTDTFAPGCNPDKDWEKFLQVVIAVDNMTIENGCLRVIPKSHTLGRVEHEDIVWNNMGHKKRAKHSEVKRAYDEFGIVNCEMKPGDMIFFNHYLLHGSSSNISPFERKVVIMQVQNHNIEKDMEVFNKYNQYRSDFLIETYQNKIDSEKNTDKYKDFTKSYN